MSVCQQPAIQTTEPPPTETPNVTEPWHPECGPNWVYEPLTSRCYAVRVGSQNGWENARSLCQGEGAELLSITSETEQLAINSILRSTVGGAVRYWMGLNDRDQEMGWQWSNGDPVPYFNWNDGEPNNAGGSEWCVELSPNWDYRWNDHSCSNQADGYLCEKIASSSVTNPEEPSTEAPPLECTTEALVSGTRYIEDQDFSSQSETEGREPYQARLHQGTWYEPANHDHAQYLQVTFPYQRAVDQITIAGASEDDAYVTFFTILYQSTPYVIYQYVFNGSSVYNFTGNTAENKNDGVVRDMPGRIYATTVRVMPSTWHNKIAMRIELHGCVVPEDRCDIEESVSGEIRVLDSGLTASSSKEGREANKARMGNSGWEAAEPYTDNDYLQLEFQTRMRIFEIQTKGRSDENRFVKKFKLRYYDPNNPHEDKWRIYEEAYGSPKIFEANVNNGDMAYNSLWGEIAATKLQIIPTEFEAGKAMRVEILACSPGCREQHVISGESYSIPDLSLTASSSLDGTHGPPRSRLYTEADDNGAGAWSALVNDQNQWLKADLGQPLKIRALSTQGRQDMDQWVKKYKVQYSNDDEHWHEYIPLNATQTKEFTAYYDRNNVRRNYFEPEFTAQYVRVHPTQWNQHISMRWDISACPGGYSGYDVGCYADSKNDRDLPYAAIMFPEGGLTRELCSHHCYINGYLYAGAQYGGECFCGNEYGRYGMSSKCDRPCTGNPYETCGGYLSNSIMNTGMRSDYERCADGYEEFDGTCFRVFHYGSGLAWGEAEYYCKQEGGDLASIGSQAENDLIQAMISELGQHAWIGLHSLAEKMTFEWSNYEPVTYTNWARREPNNVGNNEDCVNIYHDSGQWNDDDCGVTIYSAYVCEKGKEVIKTPTASPEPPDPGCGESWIPYRWKCYHFITAVANWNRHRANCEGMGGNATLARIEDHEEMAFISTNIHGQSTSYWTDLTDKEDFGTYRYSDGRAPTFTYWAPNQPDILNEEACVGTNAPSDGLWYDHWCNEEYYAICEKPSTTVEQPTTISTPANGECTHGWVAFGDYCYIARVEDSMMRLTWDNARAWCVSHNADLVSIQSQEENDFLMTIKDPDKQINYWTGLSRASGNDSFKWSDGSPFSFENWLDGEPSTDGNLNCVQFTYSQGKWQAQSCSNTKSYFCKIHRGDEIIIPSTEAYPTPDPNGDCEPNGQRWKYYNGYCYFFSDVDEQDDEYETWYDAEAWCNNKGGHLASIHSDDEMRFIIGQTRFINSRWMWIGLNELSGSESWSDGTPVEYIFWADGEPNDHGGTERCVASEVYRERHGPWAHLHCSSRYSYICKKLPGNEAIPTDPPPTPAPGNCPDGYEGFLDKCYKFMEEEATWQQAYERCYEQNMPWSLASIHNAQENAFLTAHLLDRPHYYWIGLELFDNNNFGWIDNSQVTYTNWAPHEPNGGTSEKCVHLENDLQKAGQWNDNNCETTFRFICMTYKDPELPAQERPEPGVCGQYGMNAPYDYTEYNGDCFKAQGGHRTWQAAEDHCINDAPGKGHLASIRNVYEQSFIYTIFFYAENGEISPEEDVWIGFTDVKEPGQFAWTDTSSVTYTNWGFNQPDRPEGGCVHFKYTDGTWADDACDRAITGVCRINEQPIPVTQPPHSENSTCPGTGIKGHNWLAFGNSCYLFIINETKNFEDARAACLAVNSDLVSIHSQEENDFIYAHIKQPGPNNQFWTGMTRSGHGWAWTDDSPVEFTYWSEGEPSDNGTHGENCVEMYTWSGFWNDIVCTTANGYVCMTPAEIHLTSTTPEPHPPTTVNGSHVSTPPSAITTKGPTTPVSVDTNTQPKTTFDMIAEPDYSEPLAPGEIVGIVFGVIAALLAAAIVALVIYKRRQVRQQDGLNNPLYGDPNSTENVTVDSPGISNA